MDIGKKEQTSSNDFHLLCVLSAYLFWISLLKIKRYCLHFFPESHLYSCFCHACSHFLTLPRSRYSQSIDHHHRDGRYFFLTIESVCRIACACLLILTHFYFIYIWGSCLHSRWGPLPLRQTQWSPERPHQHHIQYFGHLMQRADSLEKTLMLGKIEGKRRKDWQRMK